MTKQEAVKVLSMLKAAYPNFYKGLTKTDANGIINVWSAQFIDLPFEVIIIAVNKLISTNTFPPSIHEVKDKIQSLHSEAGQMLSDHKMATVGTTYTHYDYLEKKDVSETVYSGKKLDEKTLETVKKIYEITDDMSYGRLEPSLKDCLTNYGLFSLGADSNEKQLT